MEVRIHLMEKLSDIEVRVCDGASENIQLSAVLAAFTQAKQIIAEKAST